MNDVYNLRIGDMLYHPKAINKSGERENSTITAVIYKMTPKYIYYAICARSLDNPTDHFVTNENRAKKQSVYKSIQEGSCFISYANGTKRRRLVIIEESD